MMPSSFSSAVGQGNNTWQLLTFEELQGSTAASANVRKLFGGSLDFAKEGDSVTAASDSCSATGCRTNHVIQH